MRLHIAMVAFVLAATTVPLLASETRADETAQAKPKATKESVTVLRQKLEKARDAMRALAATPAPKALTAEQRKAYDAEMQKLGSLADGTDEVTKKIDAKAIDEGMKESKEKAQNKLDAMRDLGEMQSLHMQMAMESMSKAMEAFSNMMKKYADTLKAIIQNLKS